MKCTLHNSFIRNELCSKALAPDEFRTFCPSLSVWQGDGSDSSIGLLWQEKDVSNNSDNLLKNIINIYLTYRG